MCFGTVSQNTLFQKYSKFIEFHVRIHGSAYVFLVGVKPKGDIPDALIKRMLGALTTSLI